MILGGGDVLMVIHTIIPFVLFTHEYTFITKSQMTGSGDWQREDRRLLSTDSPNRRRDSPPTRAQATASRLALHTLLPPPNGE